MSAPLPIPFSSEERLLTNSVVTTHDIASLAFIKARSPDTAMKVATLAGQQHDAFLAAYQARCAEQARAKVKAADDAEWGPER